MLIVKQIKNPTYQKVVAIPVVYLAFPKQVANAISKSPAIINNIQFIDFDFIRLKQLFPVSIKDKKKPSTKVEGFFKTFIFNLFRNS
jgi:hypothetical protein